MELLPLMVSVHRGGDRRGREVRQLIIVVTTASTTRISIFSMSAWLVVIYVEIVELTAVFEVLL